DGVWVIEPRRGVVTEVIRTSLFPKAPEGSTPDAVAVSPDGKTLYVANADNNCVAVIDVEKKNESIVKGFIPTGWYPTAVAVTLDGRNLLVGVGKGNQTKPNPFFKPENNGQAPPGRRFPYIGTTLSGALSIVPLPDEKQLAAYTATVYRDDEGNLANAPSGYLWDACARAGLAYRSYGEYGARVSQPDGSVRMEGRVPGLVGHMCPDFAIAKNGKKLRDTDNVEVFLKE